MRAELPADLLAVLSSGSKVSLEHVFRESEWMVHMVLAAPSHTPAQSTVAGWAIQTWAQPHEYRFENPPALIESINWLESHPLLLERAAARAELHFSGRPDDTDRLLREIKATHERIGSGFIPNYLNHTNNGPDDVRRLLDGGYGVLAKGPRPLLEAYASVLEHHGCRTSLLDAPEYPVRAEPKPHVLDLSPAGVIMGSEFLFRRFANAGKRHAFVEKHRGW